MTAYGISQADRSRWQRRAAGELAALLAAHPDLPCLAWTVGPAGSVLLGRVGGLASAGQVREAFDAWRTALALGQSREHTTHAQISHLSAAARRSAVTVRLAATVFDEPVGGHA